jgi:carbonic anhydrase/acetyltransferase-like protein (isoleucine patch superfamily)
MAIYRLGEMTPLVPASAYVAPGATVIGRVTLGECASVWPAAVIRGDDDAITIGDNTNVQDGAVLHVDPGVPLAIGRDVTVGHQAMLHGCTIGDGTLVGIQAIVYNRAVIGRDCLVAAGAVVTEGSEFPDRSLIVGAPAKLRRTLTDDDLAAMRVNVDAYVRRCDWYRDELQRIDRDV